MSLVGEAPGKLLLFGEHAAVYGYPAVGIPLPWRLKVTLTQTLETDPLFHSLLDVFPELRKDSPLQIKIDSEIPIGVGFGSSGALCVALARALRPNGLDQEIWEKAHQLEKKFHSIPSGIDTGISVMEAPCFFKGDGAHLPSCEKIQPLKVPLLMGSVPRVSNTGELVRNLAQQLKTNPKIQTHIQSLGNIAKQSMDCFDDPQQFATLANQAHQHLQNLHLSNPELDEVLIKAKELGALGGKLSGAGGGGAFFIVCPNKELANKIKNRFEKEDSSFNLKEWSVKSVEQRSNQKPVLHVLPG